jgi:hypothetical protein
VMIFLFFMITDPKTIPGGQVGRILFGFLVAVASTLLMAPQTDEFGTKVGLLAGLVVICAVRPILDRFLPEPRSAEDDLGAFATRVATGGDASPGMARRAIRVAAVAIALLGLGVVVVAAGTPARGLVLPDTAEVLDRVPHRVDPGTFPTINVEQDVSDWNHEIAGPGAQALIQTLAENLELENQALLRADESILAVVDHGDRLEEMQRRLADAKASGLTTIARYRIDTVDVSLVEPFGRQDGLSLGVDARGTVTEETYDAAGNLQSQTTSPFERTFVMRRATGGRWLNVAVLPASAIGGTGGTFAG